MKNFQFKRRTRRTVNNKMNLEETLERFLYAKRLQKRSERTIKSYEGALKKYIAYCEENKFDGSKHETVESYINYLSFKKTKWDDHPTSHSDVVGVSARSVNNALSVLRVFFNWVNSQGISEDNPTDRIERLKEDDTGFEVFTDDEINLILNAPNKRTYTGFRDYVMIIVLIDTGIRLRELVSLKRGNFELKYRQLVIAADTSKSRRTRTIPLSHTTTEALQELFDLIGVDEEYTDELVFLTQFGDHFSGDHFAKNLKNYERRLGGLIKARVSPHTFRHYFAVKFLRNGGDAFALQNILGHTDLAMTQRYVRYTNADLQEIHDKASPIESIITKKRIVRGKVKFR
ncbi:tyrosine-type recombinase/integrase [Sporosarcina sp. ITBMC105]